MTRGFITIATGKELYYQLAKNLLLSYKLFTDQPYPFAIMCDRENEFTKDLTAGVSFYGASSIYVADAEGNETAIGGCGSTIDINGTTGITGTQADGIKIYTSEGALVVKSSVETTLPLYSTDGRLVERLQIAAGKNIFNTLEKGLYIINGKKVTIK